MIGPRTEMGPARLAVLLAVVAEHHERGRATVRSVAARAGLASTSTAKAHLDRLRRDGWVTWEDGTSGTLRPLVRLVPFELKADAAEAGHTTKASG